MVFTANLIVLAALLAQTQNEHVRGIVKDGERPVAGATVLSLVSPVDEPRRNYHRPRWQPGPKGNLWCGSASAKLVAELEARENLAIRVAQTTTDAEGRFTIAAAPRGSIWVDFAGRSLARTAAMGEPMRLELARAAVTTERTVVDEAGLPIAGAIVTLIEADGRSIETVTGADGKFVLGPFEYEIRYAFIRRPGYLAQKAFLVGKPNVVLLKPRSLVATIRDEGGLVAGTPVALEQGGCVVNAISGTDGRVRFDDLTPARYLLRAGTELRGANRWVELLAEDEVRQVAPLVVRPTAGIEVHVEGARSVSVQCGYSGHVPLTQEARGVFVGGQLPAGDCRVEAETWDQSATKWVALKLGQTALASMKLAAGPPWRAGFQPSLVRADVKLEPLPKGVGAERVVAVHVLDEAGRPVRTAVVERPWRGDQRAHCRPNRHANAVDASGHGWLELRAGEVLQATAPGFIPTQAEGAADGGFAEVRLARGSLTLEGVVRWKGKPAHRAMICVEGPTAQTVLTAADGSFSIPGLPAGDYGLSATRGREWSVIQTLALEPETRPIVIELQRDE